MKKRIFSVCMVICLLAVSIVSGTMAYFTDTDAKHNEIAFGKVDIELVEKDTTNGAALLPVVTEGMPAGTVETARKGNKVVDIKNNGDQDAYVRLLIAVEDTQDVGSAAYINSAYASGGIVKNNNAAEDKLVCFKGTDSNGKSDWLQIKDDKGTVYTVYGITLPKALAKKTSTESNTWPLLKGILVKHTADNAWANIVKDKYDVLVLAQGAQVIDNSKTAGENIDTAYGFKMDNNADAKVAKLFTDAELGNFEAHTYTSEGAWEPAK